MTCSVISKRAKSQEVRVFFGNFIGGRVRPLYPSLNCICELHHIGNPYYFPLLTQYPKASEGLVLPLCSFLKKRLTFDEKTDYKVIHTGQGLIL